MTAQSGFPEGKRLGYTKIGTNVRRICGEGQQRNRAALLTSEPGAANSRSHGQSAQCAHNSILNSTPVRDRLCFQTRKRLLTVLKQGTSRLSMLCSVANYLTSPTLWVPLCLGHWSPLSYWSITGCLHPQALTFLIHSACWRFSLAIFTAILSSIRALSLEGLPCAFCVCKSLSEYFRF